MLMLLKVRTRQILRIHRYRVPGADIIQKAHPPIDEQHQYHSIISIIIL